MGTRELCICTSEMEAHLLQGMLRLAGIEATIVGEAAQGAYGAGLGPQIAPPSLLVREEDLEKGLAVVNYHREHHRVIDQEIEPLDDDEQSPQDWHCPHCHERIEAQFAQCWKCMTYRDGSSGGAPAGDGGWATPQDGWASPDDIHDLTTRPTSHDDAPTPDEPAEPAGHWEAAPAPAPRAGWTCPKCGQHIEPQFDTCWNCMTEREPENGL